MLILLIWMQYGMKYIIITLFQCVLVVLWKLWWTFTNKNMFYNIWWASMSLLLLLEVRSCYTILSLLLTKSFHLLFKKRDNVRLVNLFLTILCLNQWICARTNYCRVSLIVAIVGSRVIQLKNVSEYVASHLASSSPRTSNFLTNLNLILQIKFPLIILQPVMVQSCHSLKSSPNILFLGFNLNLLYIINLLFSPNQVSANHVGTISSSESAPSSSIPSFWGTGFYISQPLSIFSVNHDLSTISSLHSWIFDTSITDHMINSFLLFTSISSTICISVQLPNGNFVLVTHIGIVQIYASLILKDVRIKDVLYVPSFHCNLISVSN